MRGARLGEQASPVGLTVLLPWFEDFTIEPPVLASVDGCQTPLLVISVYA
jgi:hypothetical protein